MGHRMKLEPHEIVNMLRYSLVGVANTATDFAAFSLLYYCVGCGPLWANSLAFAVAVSQSYFVNACWTFRQKRAELNFRAYAYFVTINLGCLVISSATIYLLQGITPPLLAKVLAAGIVLVWGFLLSRKFVFAGVKRNVLSADANAT